jgi:acetyl-CoA C-acetyltransferase
VDRQCRSGLDAIALASRLVVGRNSHRTFGDPGMGVAAKNVAREAIVTRDGQDAYALRSHERAIRATASGLFEAEVVPLATGEGVVKVDDRPRRRLSKGLMERFPAAFVSGGTVTAASSCFDADAAAGCRRYLPQESQKSGAERAASATVNRMP